MNLLRLLPFLCARTHRSTAPILPTPTTAAAVIAGRFCQCSSKTRLFEPFIYIKCSFNQDRLGTNIGKLKKEPVFLQERCSDPPPALSPLLKLPLLDPSPGPRAALLLAGLLPGPLRTPALPLVLAGLALPPPPPPPPARKSHVSGSHFLSSCLSRACLGK